MTLAIDSVVVTAGGAPFVTIAGGGSEVPACAQLVGARQTLQAEIAAHSGGWTATFALLAPSWGSAPVAPRSGTYRFEATDAAGTALTPLIAAQLPAPQLLPAVTRLSISAEATGLEFRFSPPLNDRERGAQQQAALEEEYRATRYAPMDAVFFESFFGRNASCNPLAIDRALARLRPHIARYWSVADASVAVPEGAIALIEGSAEWWRIRGSARLLVVNDWVRKRYRPRPFQKVLQTWHGTMLKKLALSRGRLGLRPAIATLRERARWDIMLAQNDYSAKIFRSAYAFLGPIWREGYPRDDVLLTGDASAVRTRLGLADDAKIVLYAPTWRDDRPDHVDHLDVARFAATLGEGWVTLIRGHSRTLLPGEDLHAHNVLDVTGYPDVSELFLVADALVTDYSSVMFDFTVTGKPVFFFTPDIDYYREKLRGFYFDLIPVAPGPVVTDGDELARLIVGRDEVAVEYATRYAVWQQRFNPKDDGGAAERVVRRLLAEGILH